MAHTFISGKNISNYKSSHSEAFCKKAVQKNFAKLIGKHQCQGLFVNKIAYVGVQLY